MPKNIRTYLYCFDNHRTFTEEIRKKFADPSRYVIHSSQAGEELLVKLRNQKEKLCRIAIIGMQDSKEQTELMDQLTIDIKKSDPLFGIILLCPPDKIEDIRKTIRLNIDAYIPQNRNFVLRVHNTVKKIFSEYSIIYHRKRRNRSLFVVLAFIIFCLLLLIFARIRFPEFF